MRIPTIDANSAAAFSWPMVCPVLSSVAGVAAAALCTWLPMLDNDCSAVLAAEIWVPTLLMVSVKAEMLASCDRAAMAKPSLEPMPA